jgi:4-diphosphocytidyl-2-C-methyl-D-erythritol kinase
MAPISVFDHLELSYAPAPTTTIRCLGTGPTIPQDEQNLAGKAARMFLARNGLGGTVTIRIRKTIPVGAGLGGGSSDAAAVLRMLNIGLGTGIGTTELADWALELGADVPFFVYGQPAQVGGIGERITPREPTLSAPMVVAFPGLALSTAAVYAAYDRSLTRAADLSSGSSLASGQTPLREILVNDLEAAASDIYPPLRPLKARLLKLGAAGALMTGSGSAVFGVWNDRAAAEAAAAVLRTTDGIWAECVEIIRQTPEVEVHTHPGT